MTIQRLYQAATGVVASDGTLTVKFQPVPTQQLWTGMVNLPNALGNEQFQAQVSNAAWGTFIGNAQFGPVQAAQGQSIQITATGLQQGLAYNAVLIGTSSADGEVPYVSPDIQQLTLAQIKNAIATFGAQEHLTNSPFSFTGSPQTETFPLPAGGPSLDGLMLVPYPSNPGQTTGTIKVVGHTTGVTYLSTAISLNPFICDFSSSADPGGVDVTFSLIGGAGNNFKLGVIGLNRSQLVRPIHGGLAEGPTTLKSTLAQNSSSTFFQVPNNGQYRVWALTISSLSTGAAAGSGYITDGTNLWIAADVTASSTTATASLSLEGGVPIGSLGSLTLTAEATVSSRGTVYWSVDA